MLDTHISYNPEYPQIQALAMRLAKDGVPEGAQLIYSGRNQVYRLPYEGMDLCIKAFKQPGFVNSRVYSLVRKSKAMRSYLYGRRLLSMHVLTPEPMACVEVCHKSKLTRSYYVCRYVEAETVREWQSRPDAEALLSAMGAEIARWHALGIWHKDLSPGNILVRGNQHRGYEFMLVDINRMEFDVTSRKKLMSNFRNINLVEAETARLARHYAAATGADPEATARLAVKQLRSYKRKKNALRIFKPHRPKL